MPALSAAKPTISHIIVQGDSLTDGGEIYAKTTLGFHIMRYLSGLAGHSPDGRFTNTYTWNDDLTAMLANQFLITKLERNKKRRLSASDIADGVIDHDPNIEPQVQHDYNLDNFKGVSYRNRYFTRNYSEGGLSAHDYRWWPSTSISRFVTRLILSNLTEKRKELLADDADFNVTAQQKAQSIIIEWSGANDLITMNAEPSIAEADRAVRDRINNVKQLLANGYSNFVLFNLPDISLTPRFQAQSKAQQENARRCCLHFNSELQSAVAALRVMHPQCNVQVFDVATPFQNMHDDPKKYGLDPAKMNKAFIDSDDFKKNPQHAPGYWSWDGLHPTGLVHELLANQAADFIKAHYDFVAPPVQPTAQQLVHAFTQKYSAKYEKQRGTFFFGSLRKSNLFDFGEDANGLATIFHHALHENGKRTREVLLALGWINRQGIANPTIPALVDASKSAAVKADARLKNKVRGQGAEEKGKKRQLPMSRS